MSSKRRRRKKHRQEIGSVPGTLQPSPEAGCTEVDFITFGGGDFLERRIEHFSDSLLQENLGVIWLDFEGLANVDIISQVGETFGIHRLALEDIFYSQRPRADDFEQHLFLNIPMLDPETKHIEQLGLLLGKDHVLTFQEGVPGDCLAPVRNRLRDSKGHIRKRGADYLAYAILDAVVDAYFPILDAWSHRLEILEEKLDLDPQNPELINDVRSIRREAVILRRTVRHLREGVSFFTKSPSVLLGDTSRPYFRDSLDHVVEVHEELEHLREWTSELLASHHSSLSQRTNEAMQTLTVIGAIFIPLSFIAGLYGMNFDVKASPWNMPELGWAYGYPMVLALMAFISGSFLLYFKRKGWL